MKLNFCTLFNSSYLSRGFVLYKSLLQHCNDFHLYVFAFDDATFDFFNKEDYEHLTVISLKEFEDADLLRIKHTRTPGEYCWTCTPATILYCIEKYSLDHCTYLDADMMFFSNPQALLDEMKDDSVLITKHNYTKRYDQSAISGIYCVQFVTFRNDSRGMKGLKWWRNACIDWCYARVEDGKFGDQKYLDDWTTRFEGIHVLQNPGGGLAPWNVQQYHFFNQGNQLTGEVIKSGKMFTPVFFHFHQLKFYNHEVVFLSATIYKLKNSVRRLFYMPYLVALEEASKEIVSKMKETIDPDGNSFLEKKDQNGLWKHNLMRFIRSSLGRTKDFYPMYDNSHDVRKFYS